MARKLGIIWGIADQALQSLINLCVGLILIRFTTKEEYGLYGLGFATLLLVVGFSNALVSTQMTIIAPTKEKIEQDNFCAGLTIGFFKYYLAISALCLALVQATDLVYDLSNYKPFVCTLILTSPIVILQEVIRRYFYIKQNTLSVLLMDIAYAIAYSIGIYIIVETNLSNKHIYTFIANGLSSLLSVLVFIFFIKINIKTAFQISSNCFKEAWKGGKWALGGVWVTWGQNQGYVYVLALLKGSELIAEANAARLFLAPIGVLSTSLSKVVMPRMAQLKAENKISSVIDMARKLLLAMLAFIFLYIVLLDFATESIIEKFSNKNYHMIDALIQAWVIYFVCQTFRNNNSIILQILQLFKRMMLSNLWIALLVIGLSFLVAYRFGVDAVIMTMSVGEILLAIIFWKIYKNEQYKH